MGKARDASAGDDANGSLWLLPLLEENILLSTPSHFSTKFMLVPVGSVTFELFFGVEDEELLYAISFSLLGRISWVMVVQHQVVAKQVCVHDIVVDGSKNDPQPLLRTSFSIGQPHLTISGDISRNHTLRINHLH